MQRFGGCIMTLVAVLSVWAALASAADQKTFTMGYDPGGPDTSVNMQPS